MTSGYSPAVMEDLGAEMAELKVTQVVLRKRMS